MGAAVKLNFELEFGFRRAEFSPSNGRPYTYDKNYRLSRRTENTYRAFCGPLETIHTDILDEID